MRLSVRVQPRSSKNQIQLMDDGTVKVRLKAAPVDGEANRELIAFLAGVCRVPQKAVSIVSGESGRNKIVSIDGLDDEDWRRISTGLG